MNAVALRNARVTATYQLFGDVKSATDWVHGALKEAQKNGFIGHFGVISEQQLRMVREVIFFFDCNIDTQGTIDGTFAAALNVANKVVNDSDCEIKAIELS